MGPEIYPYVLLPGKVHGTRPVGRPRKKWIDNIRDDCIDMGTTVIEATQWTANGSQLRCTVDLYHQHGPPTRVEIVFVATTISEVSKYLMSTLMQFALEFGNGDNAFRVIHPPDGEKTVMDLFRYKYYNVTYRLTELLKQHGALHAEAR